MSELAFLKAFYWAKGIAIVSAAGMGAITTTQAGDVGILYGLLLVLLILTLWRLKLPPLTITTAETETTKEK